MDICMDTATAALALCHCRSARLLNDSFSVPSPHTLCPTVPWLLQVGVVAAGMSILSQYRHNGLQPCPSRRSWPRISDGCILMREMGKRDSENAFRASPIITIDIDDVCREAHRTIIPRTRDFWDCAVLVHYIVGLRSPAYSFTSFRWRPSAGWK